MSEVRSQSPSHTLRDPSPGPQHEAEEWVDEPQRAPSAIGSASSMSSGSRVRHRTRAFRRRYRKRDRLPKLSEQKEEQPRTLNFSVNREATNAEPAAAAQQPGSSGHSGQRNDALKLRLDLNLDVDIQLKAKIHGDITLSLL